MTAPQATGPAAAAETDFGREMRSGDETVSLATAIRRQSQRFERADAWRYHGLMALAGFAAGSCLVLPLAAWLAGAFTAATSQTTGPALGVVRTLASGLSTPSPALVSAPRLTDRIDRADAGESGLGVVPVDATADPSRSGRQTQAAAEDTLAAARVLFRDGDVLRARKILGSADMTARGEAVFMLAETFDPNVLAALGITGVMAETEVARRLYARARELGVAAAAQRIDALR
jgi:hypothetical protein